MECLWCKKEVERKRSKYCSFKCKDADKYSKTKILVECQLCRVMYSKPKYAIKRSRCVCPACVRREINFKLDMSGEKSPVWRGGFRYWLRGRHGRDKDGLSWSVQRRLCWERDNYTCQEPGCGKHAVGWKPDCHHIVPYRISFSHNLGNLICYCKVHHKVHEVKDGWAGVLPFKEKVIGQRPKCKVCGKYRRVVEGRCYPCRVSYLVKEWKSLREAGSSNAEIGKLFGVRRETVYKRLRVGGRKYRV